MVLTHSAVTTVAVADIQVPPRKRRLRSVDDLAESINALGLLNPITVTEETGGYRLVAGYHRLEACKSLGWESIPAVVRELSELDAELAEIDENLIRNELTELERSEHLKRRKELYEARHPETKRGGDYGNQYTGGRSRLNDTVSFSQDTAAKTGQSERTIQRDVRIAQHIAEDVKDAIRDTKIADSKTDLLELARLPEDDQRQVAEKIARGEATKVKEAKRTIERERRAAISQSVDNVEHGQATVEAGQWWQLGDHLLYCGDSGSDAFVNRVPGCTFAFADPPYNAGVDRWDSGFRWQHDWLIEKAGIVAVTPGIVSIFDFARNTTMPYLWSFACWIDNGMTRGALGFGNWIYAALFSQESLYRNTQDILRVSVDVSRTDETEHRGRKPTEFVTHLMTLFSEEGDTVCDPFLGSGTTLLVAERTGRICVGAELNPEYCGQIIYRWERLSGRKAVCLS